MLKSMPSLPNMAKHTSPFSSSNINPIELKHELGELINNFPAREVEAVVICSHIFPWKSDLAGEFLPDGLESATLEIREQCPRVDDHAPRPIVLEAERGGVDGHGYLIDGDPLEAEVVKGGEGIAWVPDEGRGARAAGRVGPTAH
ncbi:inositol requiring 1-1 [Striga asiatica]|uniref:Inositol requiring 1-1 n=1 Tax=Striga asiatica TaxID=4170 RepID=A0A5A7Q4N4_STRAF|nr:inositol requiring 1-1 [Striga asiatica]